MVLPIPLSERIIPVARLELSKVGDYQRPGLAERGHVVPHVVDPD
jgi:hypothetical protein